MSSEVIYDVIIIGGGPAGLSAAVYTARDRLNTLLIERGMVGGQIVNAEQVDNYPGFPEGISGFDLTQKMHEQATKYGLNTITADVTGIEIGEGRKTVRTSSGDYACKAILIACGSERNKLGIPGEEGFTGRGVSYCALCDAPLYKDKVVAVVGGSDSAAKEALLLAKYCPKVYIIYRREKIRPEPINARRIEREPKVEVITTTNVTEIIGKDKVTAVKLDKPHNGSNILELDGIFIAIGGIPHSELAKKLGVKVNQKGEIMIDRSSRTNIEGVFAAGDVVDSEFKQAITGVGEGVHAAYQAYKYVNENEFVFTCQDE